MTKPKIVLSRCFLKPVRYNGGMVFDEFVEKLKPYIEYIDFCPESDIGLGVPRKRLIIVDNGSSKRLIQPETGKDFTDKMLEYVDKTISSITNIDGFILKAKSPSCGVGSTKLYRNGSVAGKTDGFFAEAIRKHFPCLPVEDEGRLRDEGIRTNFLTRIFAFSEIRNLFKNPEPKKLIQFHSQYKYLLMTYSQKSLKELGQLVADASIPFEEKINRYRIQFYKAFLKKPSKKRHVNTLMHLMGYVSKKITSRERNHLINLINKYNEGKIPLKVILELIKSLSYRFDNEYILVQKYLEPYPEDLDV
ncbi:MAG: YbgA family protein [Thermodesulfovibrio sp.]|uniref:YbgA family protein n=1 Tax=Thermodesulfovibrio sp. TaxID=2067987 RepID=UPI003CBE613C